MKIKWIQQAVFDQAFGHGVQFIYRINTGDETRVAFIEGYDWKEEAGTVMVYILRKDSQAFKDKNLDGSSVIELVQIAVKLFLSRKELQKHGEMNQEIFVGFNA